jgi:hypothetical protein
MRNPSAPASRIFFSGLQPRKSSAFYAAICGALSCQPGDILRFEPEAEREPTSNKENFS